MIALSNVPKQLTLTDPLSATASPQQVLLKYLSELGNPLTAAQLDQDNYNYLNPTPSGYVTLTGTVQKVDDSHADVIFSQTWSNAATAQAAAQNASTTGAIVTGQTMATITDYKTVVVNGYVTQVPYQVSVPAYNILYARGDISWDTIIGIQELDCGNGGSISMTQSQFASFNLIKGGWSFTATTGGVFDFSGSKIYSGTSFSSITATDWGGTTLIGGSINSQTLNASLLDNDTLIAGNGLGDMDMGDHQIRILPEK